MGFAAINPEQDLEDLREHSRVAVNILGRFMLSDYSEHNCNVLQMSPGDVSVASKVSGALGEQVIMYIDHIGRVEGKIIRITSNGFAIRFNASKQKRDKLAAKLTWLANRHELNLPEDRRHDRIIPQNPIIKVTLEDNRVYQGRISDLSLSGCAIEMNVKPALGTRIMVGSMSAQVVRHSLEGIAAEFSNVQRQDTLETFLHS